MGKLGNKDWWLGRTEAQQQAKLDREERFEKKQTELADKAERHKQRSAELLGRIDAKQQQLEEKKAAHKNNGSFEDISIHGATLTIKKKGTWDVAECAASVDHGANLKPRLTATRVALVGPFALLVKKDRNKVFLLVETPDEAHLVELEAKKEGDARKFALQVNNTARHYQRAN